MKNRIIPQRAPGAAHKGKRGSRVSMQSFLNLQKVRILAASIMVLTAGLAPSLWAQASPLSLADAVTMALQNDPSVQSSSWDWLAASAKADAARWRQMPSFSLSAGYQRLSDMPATTLEVPPYSFKLPASLTNAFTFAVNMQYQVFAGFRIREAAALADLQAQSKLVGIEMVKRSLMFEVRRAYWEAVRATRNRQTLQKNLELMKSSSLITAQQVAQGTATRADQLAADIPPEQLQTFKRVTETYDGEAIAVVGEEQGKTRTYNCGGCFMGITIESVNLLLTKDEIIRCPNCTRILVMDTTKEN